MAAARSFLLVLCVLLVLVGAESGQLTILHSYPEPGNFSYVQLVCVASDSSQLVNDNSQSSSDRSQLVIDSSQSSSDRGQLVNDNSQSSSDRGQLVIDSSQSSSVVSGARFQLNGTDIEEDDEIVENLDNGTILLLLTQEKEGFFTCSHNNISISTNSIGLAGMSIRPSVDGLCRDGPSEISRDPPTNRLQTQPKRLGWL